MAKPILSDAKVNWTWLELAGNAIGGAVSCCQVAPPSLVANRYWQESDHEQTA